AHARTQKAEALTSAFRLIETRLRGSDHLEMAGARLATLGDQFVADLLGLVEGRQTSTLDGADVNEHVLRAVIRLDEAETLLRIEPFEFDCRHRGKLSSCGQTGG